MCCGDLENAVWHLVFMLCHSLRFPCPAVDESLLFMNIWSKPLLSSSQFRVRVPLCSRYIRRFWPLLLFVCFFFMCNIINIVSEIYVQFLVFFMLWQDLGLEGTSLNDILYKNAAFLNLVDPISHELLVGLAREMQCPKKVSYDNHKKVKKKSI